MVALALAAGVVGYYYVIHQSRQKRLEIIHQERLVAMEKGIPLPEFPLESEPQRPDRTILPIMGVVFSALALGTMIALYLGLPPTAHSLWIAPLPLFFLGVGLVAVHLMKVDLERR